MGFFTAEQLISRAKTYCDDDHDAESGWIKPERWLELLNAEYRQLYARWVRIGLVTPQPVTAYITETDGTLQLDGVLALIGVAKDYGEFIRPLEPAQVSTSRPYWRGSTQAARAATSFAATGVGDRITVELDCTPSDLVVSGETSNYVVRYIPTYTGLVYQAPEEIESEDPYVGQYDIPYGADERLVLGTARRAHIKDSGASALINGLINDADAELNFAARAKLGGAKVKTLPKRLPFSTPTVGVWPERSRWIYF